VVFHPQAQAEYQAALAWYQSRSAQAAARFEAEVERVLALLGASPDLFPSYDDKHRFAVMRHFPYSVVYQVQPDRVYVVAVAHSSRSAGYWQGRA
jgi:plasmid stabilization system protein ParE